MPGVDRRPPASPLRFHSAACEVVSEETASGAVNSLHLVILAPLCVACKSLLEQYFPFLKSVRMVSGMLVVRRQPRKEKDFDKSHKYH